MDMRITPIIYLNTYLNVPGGNYLHFNRELIAAVEYLGQCYGSVSGSNLKKGIHYIQKETGCPSKRQIKMMLRNVEKACLTTEDEFFYIFRCSKAYYVKVLRFIYEKSNINLPANILFTEHTISKVIDGIRYVTKYGKSDEIKNVADEMLCELSF